MRDNNKRLSNQTLPRIRYESRIGQPFPEKYPPKLAKIPYSSFGIVDNSIFVWDDDFKLYDTTEFVNPILFNQ